MHPSARMGYLYLLSSAWQTDDCTVSADPLDLATESGLGDDLWAHHGSRILRSFKLVDGRYRNAVVFAEWEKARKEFEKNHGPKIAPEELSQARSMAGKQGAKKRWQKHGKRIAKDGLQEQVHIQKDKVPSLRQAQSDPRHVPFRDECQAYAIGKSVEFTWDGGEAKQLAMLLAASPGLTLGVFQQCLKHRARSVVTHGERPREWLGTILKYQEGPLDKYGSPQGASNGNRNSKTGGNIDAARGALAILAEAERNSSLADEMQPEAGGGGESGDLSHLRAGSITV